VPETLTRSGLPPGEQDPVRRDDDDLHREPRHLRVDVLVLGLRERGTGHTRDSRESRRTDFGGAPTALILPARGASSAEQRRSSFSVRSHCHAVRETVGRTPARCVGTGARSRQSVPATVQAPGEAMTASPRLWTPWGSSCRCIGSADHEQRGRAPARRVHHIRPTLVAGTSCRYVLDTTPSPFKTLSSQAMRARRPCRARGPGR
jgi:hypothetical protein